MDHEERKMRELCRLWEAIGGIKAWADPHGVIATAAYGPTPPEDRLAAIWEIVNDLNPQT